MISMHQAGFTNAVASLGTALTSGHASLLKRYTQEVLLLYDSDDAGVRAALRAIPILREAGVSSRVVNLKPHKDPDEFIKHLERKSLRNVWSRLWTALCSAYIWQSGNFQWRSPRDRTVSLSGVHRCFWNFPMNWREIFI